MEAFSQLSARITATMAQARGWASLPDPDLDPRCHAALVKRHGVPVPLGALYAANAMPRAEAERMLSDQRAAELKRRVAARARERDAERHDRMAAEWEAEHGMR